MGVNINREKESRLKKILGLKGDGTGGERDFFDPTLKSTMNFEKPRRKNFRFIEEGSLVRKEKPLGMDKEKEDAKKKKELEKKKKDEEKEEQEKAAEAGLKKIEPKILRREPIPDVEWWDLPFLTEDVHGQKRQYTEVNVEKITPYVEHPVQIKITTEKEAT